MSVQHSRLGTLLDLRQELARLERRAIGGQNAVRRRMLLQVRKCGLFQWENLRNRLEHQPAIFDGRCEIFKCFAGARSFRPIGYQS